MASCSVKLVKMNSTIKVTISTLSPRGTLKCALEPVNKYSRNTTKVSSTKWETTGHVPKTLAKIVRPEMVTETILSLEAEVTGSPRDAEGK